jgi:phenylalanyl-tRNA synthetase beta chain
VLGVLGVARELSAGLGISLKLPEPRVRELDLGTNPLTLSNESQGFCPRYIGRYIKGVKVQPSPAWMTRRLTRCGIRSINNLVDITNYVMLELGQPIHIFDANRLENRHLKIRLAQPEETLLTLEGKTATLKPDMLVIADAKAPVALAGVMGGEHSAVQPDTQDIVLESAAFAPGSVRRTSKVLGIRSESSYRFERGSDLQMVAFASRRAAQLVQELAGGLGYKPLEASAPQPLPTVIKLNTERIKHFLGADIRDAQAAELLRRLGCVISSGTSQMAITVPSWRLDITLEADLLEEIARLYGYDNIPAHVPAVHLTSVPESPLWDFKRQCAGLLAGMGYYEAMNSSTLSRAQAEFFVPGFGQTPDAKPIALANPLSLEQAILRPSLLPGLLQNACLNFQRQTPGVQFFEMGRVFFQDAEGRHETQRLALLLAGEIAGTHWNKKAQNADFYALTGSLDALAERLGLTRLQWMPLRHSAFHPRRAAILMSGRIILAWAGEIHPDLSDQLDRKEPLVAAELDIEAWHALRPRAAVYSAIPAFPPVTRDLSVTAPLDVAYEKLSRAIRTSAGALLETENLIDLFQGEKIGADKRSLTFSLVFRHADRTLNDAEIEKTMAKIVADLEKQCGAVIRS